ncbi:MAG: hypothetical protein WC511_02555 [Candidatus Pacearchaeota archaeon]
MKVVNPLSINNKTYLPGQDIPDSLFVDNPTLKKGLIEKGFILETKKNVKNEVKKDETPQPPKAVEVNTQEELKKAIEGEDKKDMEVIPLVETKIEQPAPKRGRASKM